MRTKFVEVSIDGAGHSFSPEVHRPNSQSIYWWYLPFAFQFGYFESHFTFIYSIFFLVFTHFLYYLSACSTKSFVDFNRCFKTFFFFISPLTPFFQFFVLFYYCCRLLTMSYTVFLIYQSYFIFCFSCRFLCHDYCKIFIIYAILLKYEILMNLWTNCFK